MFIAPVCGPPESTSEPPMDPTWAFTKYAKPLATRINAAAAQPIAYPALPASAAPCHLDIVCSFPPQRPRRTADGGGWIPFTWRKHDLLGVGYPAYLRVRWHVT